MGLLDDIKAQGAAYRLTEEALYAEVLREMEGGIRRDGLWAKALSDSQMDQTNAKALYIKLRVQSLKDEAELLLKQCREISSNQTQRMLENQRQKSRRLRELNRQHSREEKLQKKQEDQDAWQQRLAYLNTKATFRFGRKLMTAGVWGLFFLWPVAFIVFQGADARDVLQWGWLPPAVMMVIGFILGRGVIFTRTGTGRQ